MEAPQELREMQDELDRFTRDTLYLDQHRRELLQQYPERWVAIFNQQVVGAAKDPKRLISQLERKGIPRGRAYLERLSTKEEILVLPSPAR